MKNLRTIKAAVLFALIGIGMAASLSACLVEEGGRGGGYERLR